MCRLLLPVTLSPEFTFARFYFQRNPHCAWEGHPAKGCSEPDWDKHRRRGPVLSLPLYCPGMRCTLEVETGSWVEQVASFLTCDKKRFISPLRKPGCRAGRWLSRESVCRAGWSSEVRSQVPESSTDVAVCACHHSAGEMETGGCWASLPYQFRLIGEFQATDRHESKKKKKGDS